MQGIKFLPYTIILVETPSCVEAQRKAYLPLKSTKALKIRFKWCIGFVNRADSPPYLTYHMTVRNLL